MTKVLRITFHIARKAKRERERAGVHTETRFEKKSDIKQKDSPKYLSEIKAGRIIRHLSFVRLNAHMLSSSSEHIRTSRELGEGCRLAMVTGYKMPRHITPTAFHLQ